jgi:hypothetical protein
VNFAAITLYVASQRVFIVVSLYFVIDSVRKLLDTPYYSDGESKTYTARQVETISHWIGVTKKTMNVL